MSRRFSHVPITVYESARFSSQSTRFRVTCPDFQIGVGGNLQKLVGVCTFERNINTRVEESLEARSCLAQSRHHTCEIDGGPEQG